MSSDVILFCEQLKSTINCRDTKRASKYLDAIDQYFNDRISENEIDLAIDKVFADNGGILGFLKCCSNQSKLFKNENIKSFELLAKVIELYKTKVKDYATNAIVICLTYIRSMQTSARESEKAIAVIEKLIANKCCDDVDRSFLMKQLLQIIQQTKSGTVQSRIFELIGGFAKDYPDCIENEVDEGVKIRDMYFQTMEKAVVGQQEISLIAITGAFNGLNDFLENFGPHEEHKEAFAKRAYDCIKPFAKPLDSSSKAVNKCALKLLACRCDLFRKEIFNDFFFWHDLLVDTWLKMEQFENRRTAIHLLHAIHREIAEYLLESSDSERCQKILSFLQTYFKAILESTKSQPYEIRLAIVGFGQLAAPCKNLLSAAHVDELFNLVIQRTKSVSNAVNQNNKDQLEHFPDYVEALSRIMEHVQQLSGIHLHLLQDIVVSVIRNFPLLGVAIHAVTINTLMRTFHNLFELGGSILSDVLEKVIYQGVIWTCSHKLPFDATNDWIDQPDWKEQITYHSYLPLWNGFSSSIECSTYNRMAIVKKIYDQMIITLFKILDKLDLSLRKRVYRDDFGNDRELFFSDPNYDLEPVRSKDFHIFFNLVDFYRELFKSNSMDKNNFIQWINQLVEKVIGKSLTHPLVSGFIGLMQTFLRISNRINYFGNDLYPDNAIIYNSVYYYLKITMAKAQQSHGEFQIACLKLAFSTPTCMLPSLIKDMTPVLKTALEIGKSITSLFIAEMALHAIEQYMEIANQSSSETKIFLRTILPYFDTYLRGFKNDTIQTVEVSKPRTRGPKRTAQKLIKLKENDLQRFQKRILLFLGTLEPEYCLYLVQDTEYTGLVRWNTTQTVRLTLYGNDFHPKIYLDTLMPRICEIATSTTDRQKKVTACEIIHATILYLLGSYNHRGRLWAELCPLMLQFACDNDESLHQMFEPLVMETMHYISKTDQLHQQGTEILLKCVMDAICHPTNLPVRDLASRSLREFLSWTFRQSTPQQLNASPFNIDTIIHQLKMFNCDTLPQRRFGAALAFNNIYRVLREEESIIDKYWIDLLHDFCVNLKLSEQQQSEENANNEADVKQVSASLDHILRVLRERKDIFNASNSDRIKPTIFADSLLRDAVLWLLSQCNSMENQYRKKVMDMFLALAPCIDGYSSSAALVRDTHTTETVIKFCENEIQLQIEFTGYKTIYTWLRHLYTSLDCYIWFIDNSFVIEWQSVFEKSQIFKALELYINNIMNKNLFQENRDTDSVSLIQKEKINVEKSAIMIQFFQFLNKTMAIEYVPDVIWQSRELIWAIETSVFRPQFLECSTINAKFLSTLPKHLESFACSVERFAPDGFKNALNQQLVSNMMDTYQSLADSIEETMLNYCSISTSDTNKLNGVDFVCGLVKTKSSQVNDNIAVLAKKVLYHIFDGIIEKQTDFTVAKSPSPDILKFTAHMLQVCLHNSHIHINLIDLLLNTTDLILCDSLKPVKHGQHFLSLYKTVIYPYFVKNVDIIVERLISKMMLPNITYVLRMLIEIVSEAHKTAAKNINQMKTLTNILLSNWMIILKKSKPNENDAITMVLIELIERIAIICPYELTEISSTAKGLDEWLLNLIKNEKCDLEIKTQAILLLPCIIGPTTYEHAEVQNSLNKLQMEYFPLFTEELRIGSVARASYENLFQAILETMHTSRSPVMLKFVIFSSCPDPKHIFSYKIIECVRKFMAAIELKHQLNCLNLVFDLFLSRSYDPAVRTTILKRIFLEMLLSSAKTVVVQFYATHIRAIEQLLETPYGLEMSEFRLEQAFTSRIGGFELLETLIAILTREEICDKTCPIVVAKFGDKLQKGNELLAWMTQKAVSTEQEVFQTNNTKYMELFRKYQCSAFKALCAFICNTQDKLKFYEFYIFNKRKWLNMINVIDSKLYMNQTIEVDKKPKIKERLVSIRSLKNTNASASRSQKYIESQTVFESSLSQDVTKIDLSAAYVRTSEEVENRDRLVNYQPKTLMLEKNCINDHEIMATVCGVVDHMFENEITSINDDGTLRRQKLAWVECVCNTIANKNNDVHINVRIFLATMVDNCSDWFRNYADDVAPSILKFLIDWINLNNGIDALAVFLMVDLLEWDSTYRLNTVDEQALAIDFIAKFMELISNQERDVFRRNLELIQNLMDNWREFIRLPYNLLYERINDTNNESKLNICGIQLNGIVLTIGLIPWNEETKEPFLRAISNCLNNRNADVYQPAAQVLGMILHEIIVKENAGSIDQYKDYVDDIVARLKQMKQTDETKFMYTLGYVDKHFVIDEFHTTILNLIPKSIGVVKERYLKMYLARINEKRDPDFDSRDIEMLLIDLLNQLNEQKHQLIGLHIFNKALSILSINQIKSLLPRITAYQDADQTDLRNLVYEIMKFIRDKHGNDEELNRIATDILLRGLNDVDTIIQSSVFKYWCEILASQTALNQRILYVLRHLYSADFLKYGVQLLIDLNSANLKKKLLQDRGGDDDDSKYTEYDINVRVKKYDSNYNVPMFAESTQKHIINDELSPTNVYLRATQNTLLFDPTLDPSMVHQESSSFSLQSPNSLQFQVQPQMLDRRSKFVQSPDDTKPKKFDYLRERILRKSQTVARQRAMDAVQKQTYRQVKNTLQQQQKAGQVVLYRRYRFGEYPDFFINSLAFLLPLQILVKMDVILAKKTFTAIVNSVYTELEIDQKHGFLRDLATIVNNIQCDSMLFSAMAEIAFTNSVPLNIGPNVRTSIGNANDMMINIVLMLENQLIYSADANEDTWSQLAELYYNLSEHDIAASIFANKINSDPSLAKAIEYESNRDYLNALKLYMEFVNNSSDAEMALFNKHVNDRCQQFSFNSIFNCYEEMGRWEDLERSVIEQLTDDDGNTIQFEQLWSDEWNIKYLLPHYIRSEIHTLIYTETNATNKFLTNIQGWLHNPERAQLIKRHFGEQLMILHMANKDYLQAKVYSNQCLETFIEEWSQISNLSEKMRRDALMNIRRIAEAHKYADVLLSEHIDDTVIAKLCDRWKRTETNQADSTAMWESLISYRIFITEHALEKFNPKDHPIVDRLIESMFDMQFKLNEIAIQQQNVELSNSVVGRLDSFRRIYGKSTLKSVLQYELTRIRRDRIKCMKQTNANTHFDSLLRIWMDLQQFQRNHSTELDANPNIHIKLFEQFNELMTNHSQDLISNCKSVDPSTRQQLIELTACVGYSPNLAAQIALFSTECCSKMIGLLENCEISLNELLSLNFFEKEYEIGESYFRLAIFCLKHYSSGLIVDQLDEISQLLVKSILRGMRHGSKSARLQFPRLLQLPNINSPELTEIFTKETNQVPLWTFLDSTTQIMSRFDFKKPCFLDTLLLRLATTYPSIIIYAFQLSYNIFCEQHQSVEIRPLVQQILNTIENPLIEKFINGMKCLSLPDKVIEHHLYRILNRSNLNVNTEQQLKDCYDIVFGNTMRGKSAEKVLPLKNNLIEIMNMDRSNPNEFNNAIKQLLEKLRLLVSAKQKSDDSRRINNYCPWLAHYHWFGSADFIELPGQYNGNTSPNAQNRPKIVKFNENISICHSLRKPIKITAICSDGKSYSFLIKYGEDLRQDDRIQHIQDLMSDQMQLDKSCSQQKIVLRTYKVIPLNTTCGLISWIQNTDSIQSFLLANETKWNSMNTVIRKTYNDFITRHDKKDRRPISSNVKTVLHYTPQEIAENMEKLQSQLPEGSLRKALYKLSASPECFFVLRNNFGKSLAAMSVVNWILTIGDRNLGNFLIDKTNGSLIGIDFNMAFGAATRNLNIPELVPFRLTSQFVNTLKPLGTDGFFVKTMSHVLRTFSIENESLLAALEVFIHEPTIDYMRARSLNSSMQSQESLNLSTDIKIWKPEQHLKTIRDKLAGMNPISAIENDIKASYHSGDPEIVLAYTNLIKGQPHTYRYRKQDSIMTIEEQVKCLIDISTDLSVLGASYIGFQPWV